MQSCHGLFKDVYLQWASQMRGGAWILLAQLHGPAGVAAIEGGAAAPLAVADGDAYIEEGGGVDPSAPRDAADDKAVWQARQEEQAKYRRDAAEWLLLKPPLPELVIARMTLGPMAALFDAYLPQAGSAWDRKQVNLAAAFASSGCAGANDGWGVPLVQGPHASRGPGDGSRVERISVGHA